MEPSFNPDTHGFCPDCQQVFELSEYEKKLRNRTAFGERVAYDDAFQRTLRPETYGRCERCAYRAIVRLNVKHRGSDLEPFESEAEKHASQAFKFLLHDIKVVNQFEVQADRGCYRLDFFMPEHWLAIEIDGPHHLEPEVKRADQKRDAFLRQYGIETLRFSDKTVYDNPKEVVRWVRLWLTDRERYYQSRT